MKKIRLLIIGAGKMAKFHIEAFSNIQDVEIVGVISKSGTSAEILAKKNNIPYFGNNWMDFVKRHPIDACVIAVSHFEVEKISFEVINAGYDALIEKPICISSVSVLNLADIAQKKGLVVMAGVNRRFYPTVLDAYFKLLFCGGTKQLQISAPDNGDIFRLKASFSDDVYDNWFVMNTIHAIDLIRFFSGEPEDVSFLRIKNDDKAKYNLLAQYISSNNIAVQFSNYSSGGDMNSWLFRLQGEGLNITLFPLEKISIKYDGSKMISYGVSENAKFKHGIFEQAKYFINACMYSRKVVFPASDLFDHAKTLELVEKISDN